MRALLTALGIAVGVAAVVLLTSIGEGVQHFVLAEFTQFGTNLISVAPGTTETMGGSIGAFGTVRPLTIDDAEALQRASYVIASVPMVQGNAEVEANGRKRRVTVYGIGPEFAAAFRFDVAQGHSCRRTTRVRRAASPCSARRWRRSSSAMRTRSARRCGSAASATASSA